ncbi:hypothetical protein [Aurantimonas sp. VKM B-3413]|uniref:hypothetical protein n=1 Tax=Aurantimonas sp. VKM B-3413 TaxID=2779401 RepID=UPI001E5E68F4|nr:hypothetical protein [Aurantimonas sp. VKM B-3413]MCB8835852.1 hypothetical protein [Aurantimonas sp. VKM B-3413]
MSELHQLNLRVPRIASAEMRDVAKALREDPAFRHQVRRLLDERTNPAVLATHGQRLDRLEKQLAELTESIQPGRQAELTKENVEPNQGDLCPSLSEARRHGFTR